MNTEIEQFGEENEDDVAMSPNTFPNQAVLWGTDWTTETIINQLKKGNIELNPKFQRRDAWSASRKSSFIESLFLGLPVPQIILAERQDKRGSYIVIDGKQRLLSIRQFCAREDDSYKSLKLTQLEVLKDLNGKSYEAILQSDNLNSYLDAFENQSIRTIVIKNWKDEKYLYTVFLRLNKGSLQLSPQELRQALHTGPFSDFADDYCANSSQIKSIFKSDVPDFRMRDVELYVRYFAFRYDIQEYTGNLKVFLDKTWINLNKHWENQKEDILNDSTQLTLAIDACYKIFGYNGAFRKWTKTGPHGNFQGLFNRAVYDIMVYYFSHERLRNEAIEKAEAVIDVFKQLCIDDLNFTRSIETTTKSITNTVYRYRTWGLTLTTVLDISIDIPHINSEGKISVGRLS
jgi:hypothetical protein